MYLPPCEMKGFGISYFPLFPGANHGLNFNAQRLGFRWI